MSKECERQIKYSLNAVAQLVTALMKNDRIHGDHILYALSFAAEDLKNAIIAAEVRAGRHTEEEAEALALETIENAIQTATETKQREPF